MSDQVERAIAAAEAQERVVPMRQINVTISSTGRPAALAVPVDATEAEIAEVAGWLLTSVLQSYRAERAKADASAPRILTPAGVHVVR